MKHYSVAVAILLSLIVAAASGCREDTGQAVGPDARTATSESALEGQINDLIDQLFPEPEEEQADKLFAEMKSALAGGNQSAAQDAALELLALAGSTDLEDPEGSKTASEGLSELIGLLSEFTGLEVPEPPPELLSTDGDDGVIAVAFDGEDNTIVTRDSFAGTFIPDEAIDENVLIVIDRKTSDDLEGEACLPLPTSLEQAGGCYQFDREPEGVFQDSVDVGVCPDPAIEDDEGYQLHEFENAGDGEIEGVEALTSVAFPDIDCTDFTVSSTSKAPLPWRLARAAWGATGGQVINWLRPAPAWAIDAGNGGSTLDFSRIGWAKQMDVDEVEGGTTAPAGAEVSPDPRVRVTHLPEGNESHPIEGTAVTFTVVEGNGTVAGGDTSTTVTTDGNGNASSSWTLGSGANELEAVVPGDTVLFTASSAAFSASIAATSPTDLDEGNLDGSTVTVDISGGTYASSLSASDFNLASAPPGTSVGSVTRESDASATLTLSYDGTDFDTDQDLSVEVTESALATGDGPATTGTVTVTARNTIFEADFDNVTVGQAPPTNSPQVGTWSVPDTTNTEVVVTDTLLSLPGNELAIQRSDSTGTAYGVLTGFVEDTSVSSGVWSVEWAMVPREQTDVGSQGVAVRALEGDTVATVSLTEGGLLLNGGDTGGSVTPNQVHEFRIEVDLDAGELDLFVDGALVEGNVLFANSTASSMSFVDLRVFDHTFFEGPWFDRVLIQDQ